MRTIKKKYFNARIPQKCLDRIDEIADLYPEENIGITTSCNIERKSVEYEVIYYEYLFTEHVEGFLNDGFSIYYHVYVGGNFWSDEK